MQKKNLFVLWGVFFILCAALGFIPEPQGAIRILMTGAALLFFLPPALLLYNAVKQGDAFTIKLIRNLSALSLFLTLDCIVLNILSALGSARLGDFLHGVLVIISSPMICSGHWALTLFLWACLLMVSLKHR